MEWKEIRSRLKQVGVGLKSHLPFQYTFSSNNKIFFLSQHEQASNTLFSKDLSKGNENSAPKACLQKFLADEKIQPKKKNDKLSQDLLRERMRIKGGGISNYSMVEYTENFAKVAQIIASIGSQLIVYQDDGVNCNTRILDIESGLVNTEANPYEHEILCGVFDNNIAIIILHDPHDLSVTQPSIVQVTHVKKNSSAGMPSYIVQEEFDRYVGCWWRNKTDNKSGNNHQLLYEEVDTSAVDVIYVHNTQNEYPYPRAGTPNATSKLKILDFHRNHMTIEEVRELKLPKSLNRLFPEMEYLVDAGWLPNNDFVYAVMMNRAQTLRKVFLIPYTNFKAHNYDGNENDIYYEILTQSSEGPWINHHHLLYFLKNSDNNKINVIYGNENSKHLHLHYSSYDLKQCFSKNKIFSPQNVIDKVLTQGNWDVDGRKMWVDEEKNLVFFMAYKETPLETHLYAVNYLQPSNPCLLTKNGFSHSVELHPSFKYFVSCSSSVCSPDRSDVYAIESTSSSVVSSHFANVFKKNVNTSYSCSGAFTGNTTGKNFEFINSFGVKLYGLFIEPQLPIKSDEEIMQIGTRNFNFPSLEKNKKYPVILSVYGGPGVQYVTNTHSLNRHQLQHKMSRMGFCVLMLDNRGSYHRGLGFEQPIQSHMGKVEVEDQVEGLLHAHKLYPQMDLDRVAVMGWSYGGFMSLMCLAQKPDVFKLAISGAPVTSWRLYDTAYTERYLGDPNVNTEAYNRSSVLQFAKQFPDQTNRLLIIHGLMDENVHFEHTSSLVDMLNSHCKPFNLHVYPKERHGIRSADSYNHYETLVLHFLINNI